MQTIGEAFNLNTLPVVYNHKQLSINDRHVGLECEREDIPSRIGRLFNSESLIGVKDDGSLRNRGYEFVFASPYHGSTIILALKELNRIFKAVNPAHSKRTSDHIHVNIRDFSLTQLNTLIYNLILLEDTIYRFGSPFFNRKNNTYCFPFSKYLEQNLNNVMGNTWMFSLPKYLNYRFVKSFGSLEFRMFESTDSVIELLNRINICLELVDNSKKGIKLNKNLSNLIELLPKTYQHLTPFVKPTNPEWLDSIFLLTEYRTELYNKVFNLGLS